MKCSNACRAVLLAAVLVVGFAAQGFAAGFALYEWSNRGNGMAGAMTALADDPSAIAYNPAGITQLEGTHAMVGSSFVAPSAEVNMGGETYKTKNKVYTIPHAYFTQQINDQLWVGIGEYSRFGVGTNYDHDWAGANNVYKAVMKSFSIAPVMAVKVTDNWSVAGGMDFMRAAFEQKKMNPALGDIHIKAEGWTVGWNLSTRYEFNDQWSVGLVYRGEQKMVGRGTQSNSNGVPYGSLTTMVANLPSSITAGIAYKPTEDLRFDFDVIRTHWSSYDSIEYNYDGGTDSVTSVKNYNDAMRYALGVEYDLTDAHVLRAGFVYDESPIEEGREDFMLPTSDRYIYSLGYGYKHGDWTVDFSGMYVRNEGRVIEARPAEGIPDTAHIHNSKALVGGMSIGYSF